MGNNKQSEKRAKGRRRGEAKPDYLTKFGKAKKLKPIASAKLTLNAEERPPDEVYTKEIAASKPKQSQRRKLSPAQLIALGMLAIIVFGTLFLALPISNANGKWLGFLPALFSSVSLVCVTGLGFDINTFSLFGQIISLLLIQLGGLGFMALATLLFFIIGKRITLSNRLAMQEALNHESTGGTVRLMRSVFYFTFIIEGVGALIYLPFFVVEYGVSGIFKAIFLSVSAFCNAGISLISGVALDMVSSQGASAFLMIITALLIIVGGLGFTVHANILKGRSFKKLDFHSRIVIYTTLILIGTSFLFFLISEFSNPNTIGNQNFFLKIANSFFHAVSTRTAGFSAFNQSDASVETQFFTIICMLIGASPASTGGGIKTTTIAILLLMVVSFVRGRDTVTAGKNSVSMRVCFRAATVLLFAMLFFIGTCMALMLTESGNTALHSQQNAVFMLIYEAASAFSTTGFSLGATDLLSTGGKIVLMIAMFIGRIGTITIGLAVVSKGGSQVKYPEQYIMIG